MSPIVKVARERLDVWVRANLESKRPPPDEARKIRQRLSLRRLIDDLIGAVRGEQKGDLPF